MQKCWGGVGSTVCVDLVRAVELLGSVSGAHHASIPRAAQNKNHPEASAPGDRHDKSLFYFNTLTAPGSSSQQSFAAAGKANQVRPKLRRNSTMAASSSTVPEAKGYKGFGSFHSENVEGLIAGLMAGQPLPEVASPVAAKAALAQYQPATAADFGSASFKKANFFVDPAWTFLNHGAFGGAHRLAAAVANAWREHCETQPLRFIDRQLFAAVAGALAEAAASVGTPVDTLTFVPNATTGINAVLAAVPFEGDKRDVFMLDIGYGSVKKITREFSSRAGGAVHMVHVPLPLRAQWEDDIVDLVSRELRPASTALAVFDHVTSNTALVLPVKRLTQLCAAKGVPVLIDGAHAWGSLPLDVADIGADFYVTNAHKWLSCPKGVGVLAVKHAGDRARVRSPVMSHGWDAGFHSSFMWDGCRDYAAVLSVPAMLQWWTATGPSTARAYTRALRDAAVAELTSAWGTGTQAPLAAYGPMTLVQVPRGIMAGVEEDEAGHAQARHRGEEGDGGAAWSDAPAGPYTSTHAKVLQDALHEGHRVEAPVKCLGGWLFLRLSFAVYNCAADYKVLQEAVLGMVEDGGLQWQ